MKKLLLVSTLVFFLSNISFLSNTSFAAECVNGENLVGCTISTTGSTYTLTGDITPASGTSGINFILGTDNNATLTGNITTLGNSEHGLIHGPNSRDNISIIIGDISTSGREAYAVFLNQSSGNTSTLTGNVITTGESSSGLYIPTGNDNVINMSGNITTENVNAEGVDLTGSSRNTITLNGNILTNLSSGLLVNGGSSNNHFSIFGNITSGVSGFKLQSDSDYNNLTLDGNINAVTHGLELSSVNNNIVNISGNITTTGSGNPTGLYFQNSLNNTISLTGDINSTGSSTLAFGVLLFQESDFNTINLTGSLSATSTGSSYAIYADSRANNNAITFNQKSRIIGDLYNDGANNTLKFNLGGAASYNFTTSGNVDWVLEDTSKTVISGSAKSRGVADIDDSGNRLYQRFSQINSSLTKQHREVSYGEVRGSAWIDTYYNDSERDNVPSQINQNTRGVTMGFPVSSNSAVPIDVIVNYENSSVAYGLSEQNITSNSFMVGVALPELMKTKEGSLAMKLLAGLSNNDRDLTVLNNLLTSGKETVTDKYNSFYVNAGAEWMQRLYKNEYFQHDIIIGMDINHERIDSSVASGYYILDDREITQLVSQAQYGVTFTNSNKKLKINGSAGLAYSDMIDGEKQNYSIDGTSVSYTSDKNNTYAIASLGVRYQFTPLSYAYANVKRFESTDNIDGTTGNIGLIVQF